MGTRHIVKGRAVGAGARDQHRWHSVAPHHALHSDLGAGPSGTGRTSSISWPITSETWAAGRKSRRPVPTVFWYRSSTDKVLLRPQATIIHLSFDADGA